MHIVQIMDSEVFERAAKSHSVPVQVTATPKPLPVLRAGGEVEWRLGLLVDYVMEFQHPSHGASRWVYREMVFGRFTAAPLLGQLQAAGVPLRTRA